MNNDRGLSAVELLLIVALILLILFLLPQVHI